MIYYVVTRGSRNTINRYRHSWGTALRDRVLPFPYEDVFKSRRVPAGTYIFSDVERLSPEHAERAALVKRTLDAAGCRTFNHPTRSMRRYELLRTLHERGTNAFDVYRVTEVRPPVRFPVFVRCENDHRGSGTGLLADAGALSRAIDELEAAGVSRERLLIEEFCDTADAQGLYRKYSAFLVGDRLVPRHLFFSDRWMLKSPHLVDPAKVDEELAYLRENPHEQELRAIFGLARIDYGRIDYSVRDGRLQVWEINTNPWIMSFIDGGGPTRKPVHEHFAAAIHTAFGAIDGGTTNGNAVDLGPAGDGMAAALRDVGAEVYHWAVRSLGLLDREAMLMERLKRWTGRS